MTSSNSQNDQSLEALTSQALALATDLSRALDHERDNSNLPVARLRHLAIPALDCVSKIVVLLLSKDETPQ